MIAVQITVHGKVQGVFFRKSAQQAAASLQLNGFVRNKRDGSVYIEACGEPAAIAKMLEWCSKGPSGARVEKVEHNEIPIVPFSGFEIRGTI